MTSLSSIFFLLIGITYPLTTNATESAKKDTKISSKDKVFLKRGNLEKEKETQIKPLPLFDKQDFGRAEPFKPRVAPLKKDLDQTHSINIPKHAILEERNEKLAKLHKYTGIPSHVITPLESETRRNK